jgi:hypothetical protein
LPLRVLYMNTCLVGWVIYLSVQLIKDKKATEKKAIEAAKK